MIKVTVRKKKIKGNRESLFLDFYPAITNPKNGKSTRREFLGLYVQSKPKGLEKEHNRETLLLAQQIAHKRHNEINKPEAYTESEKRVMKDNQKLQQSFYPYYEKVAARKKSGDYDRVLILFKEFTGKDEMTFADITERTLEDFKHWLLEIDTINQNTASTYFSFLRAVLRQSYKDGIIAIDLPSRVARIPKLESKREHLTIEEVNKLASADCTQECLKHAALFSVLTGLRFSDIKKLKWKEAEQDNNNYRIRFTQKKTSGVETLPISKQAFDLMGKRGDPEGKVFDCLRYASYHNYALAKWIKSAGITKHITFHCFRHTYATLQLSNGTDIYTVSKMLGHKDLKTTAIYAKIVDEKKREAANKITLDL